MKLTKTYSVLTTVGVFVLFSAIILVNELAGFQRSITSILLSGVVAVGGLYLIVRFFLIRYAARKIDPIAKTIQSNNMSQKNLRDEHEVKIGTDYQSAEIKKLRKVEKYRRDFLGNVSHELKTPIFNIQGYILTLLDGGIQDDNINKLYLKRTEKSINRLINIVDDLDSIARLESGEFILRKESFNIVKVVEEVLEYQELSARQNNIKTGFDDNYKKAIRVMADKKRIMEVLSNLISNSIKYGKSGGKTTIGFLDTGKNILVDITDNGIGIEEKNLPRIFERFYRVDKSRSRESGGTGLGLSIVKHTIQAHNQTITVKSKNGQGSSFIFSLEKA